MQPSNQRCGRLAPSPTGALHLGNLRTFMVAWLQMRACGGTLRMRIEDLDHPKHKVGSEAQILDDLAWLTFDWDGPVVIQSQRTDLYRAALAQLAPHLYACHCSRADIQGAQSAPHPGEVLRYPGTCRQAHRPATPTCAWRYALTPEERGTFVDGFAGPQERAANDLTGDFVVARGEEPAYTLAVVVDDLEMGITDIVRGDDILPATPAQVVLYHALGAREPTFWHVPLVVGSDLRRLAKRHGDTRIATYRAQGHTPGELLTWMARSCGWLAADESVSSLAELLPRFNIQTIPHTPFIWSEHEHTTSDAARRTPTLDRRSN